MSRHFALYGLFAVLLCGCAPPLPAPQEQQPGTAPAAKSQVRMEGMVLRLYDENPDAPDTSKPSFWVRADNSTLLEDGVWSFDGAQAVIYDRKGGETKLTAAKGRVDQRTGSETAILEDGVTLHAGDLSVDLSVLVWNNAKRVAESDKPVTITQGENEMTASSLKFYPDEDRLVLTNVKGTLDLNQKGDVQP